MWEVADPWVAPVFCLRDSPQKLEAANGGKPHDLSGQSAL
jgi:hypothetical protein